MSPAAQTEPEQGSAAELFISEGRQAVRLPIGIHLDGDSVQVRRVPNGILLEPAIPNRRRTSAEVKEMFEYIDSLDADDLFPEGRDQGIAEERMPID